MRHASSSAASSTPQASVPHSLSSGRGPSGDGGVMELWIRLIGSSYDIVAGSKILAARFAAQASKAA